RSNSSAAIGAAAAATPAAAAPGRGRGIWGRSASPLPVPPPLPPPMPAEEVSDVTFFTHLSFSEHLPVFEELEACKYYVGPLHILQELKRVVEQTLGGDDLAAVEISGRLKEGDGGEGAVPLGSGGDRGGGEGGGGRRHRSQRAGNGSGIGFSGEDGGGDGNISPDGST
ncbi:unnamed protein product, partial [Phaeothamnion confervicola]